jgi:hypothetical protein
VSYVYLASPYTHKDPAVRLMRYQAAVKKAAQLMRDGEVVFCPIAHSHDIGIALGMPTDHEFWMKQDMPLLANAAKVVVLRIEGWSTSSGVNEEIKYAEQHGIPVEYVDP